MNDEPCYLAVETGGTKILAQLVCGAKVVGEGRWATGTPADAARDLIAFVDGATLRGIGIAAFGPIVVDPAAADYGKVLATPKPGWTGANLRRTLSERFAVPAAIDTDVNLAAVAEQRAGAGQGCASLAYVTVGTGIGGGLVRDGHTLTGALHPEIGHVPVIRVPGDDHASACPFHPSCAEGLAAGPAVQARLAGRALADLPADFAAIADYLGQLFATMVLAWTPQRIVAGGGVLSVPGLREAAERRMLAALGGYGVGTAAGAPGFIAAPMLENPGLQGALIRAREVAA